MIKNDRKFIIRQYTINFFSFFTIGFNSKGITKSGTTLRIQPIKGFNSTQNSSLIGILP